MSIVHLLVGIAFFWVVALFLTGQKMKAGWWIFGMLIAAAAGTWARAYFLAG